MTTLTVWKDDAPSTPLLETTDAEEITRALAAIGVGFERWPVRDDIPPTAGQDEVLAAYRAEVDRVTEREGFISVDVASIHPSDDPGWADKAKAAREKFINEHTHDDDNEVRFFVRGAGVFYLHLGDEVHAVLGEAGDLLSVPKGTTHWFDMGEAPDFTAIRFFTDEDGWVGNFTGSDISGRFPTFDELRSRADVLATA